MIATVLVVGVALAAVGVGFGAVQLIRDNDLVPVSSHGSVTVTLPGGQDLLYVGLLGERSAAPFGPQDVQIVKLSSGLRISTEYDPSLDRNSPDGIGSLGLISFVVPTTGTYRVTIDGPRGLRVWAGTSPGTTVHHLVPWFLASGLGLAVLGCGIAGAVIRSRELRTTGLLASVPPGAANVPLRLPRGRVVARVRGLAIFRQPLSLASPLRPDEVARRLDDNLAPGLRGMFVGLSTRDRRRGKVDGSQFRVRARSGIRNSATFEFHGRIEPLGAGSKLVGDVGPSGSTPAFAALWLGVLSIFELFFVILALDPGSTTPRFDPVFALFPLAMGAGGLLIIAAITAQAAFAWRSTESWLMDLLSATRLDPTQPSAGVTHHDERAQAEEEFRSMYRD